MSLSRARRYPAWLGTREPAGTPARNPTAGRNLRPTAYGAACSKRGSKPCLAPQPTGIGSTEQEGGSRQAGKESRKGKPESKAGKQSRKAKPEMPGRHRQEHLLSWSRETRTPAEKKS